MRSEQEVRSAIENHSDTVRRICFVYLKNHHDVDDVFQEVFLKYLTHDQIFEDQNHEKAWFIRVAINTCKDTLKNFFRRKVGSLDELLIEPSSLDPEHLEVLEAILKLPEKYRIVVYLFYYEGYSAIEIAQLLKKKENTIYTWLSRAKAQLKELLGGESFGE